MKLKISQPEKPKSVQPATPLILPNWVPKVAWVAAGFMLLLLVAVVYQLVSGNSILDLLKTTSGGENQTVSSLPALPDPNTFDSIIRKANLDTNLPVGYRKDPVEYEVELGDSIFGIAAKYEVEPESILWANFDTLNDDPHLISLGTKLHIPPVDGILYKWQEGDTLENIAAKYKANMEDILLWPGNYLDMTNPIIQPGTVIMIPGGSRELVTWIIPVAASSEAGVNAKISGPGSCTTSGGAVGSGSFIFPTAYGALVSGNDYWSGHRALDFMCYEGDAIFASDSGVVIYAGSISGGYGNLVAIDHGNSYLTLYAHLSSINVSCGQSVFRGSVIGGCGSTGNSTGPHLHFEVRKGSLFINPWQVLQ